mgnify:CR=1 FL=1
MMTLVSSAPMRLCARGPSGTFTPSTPARFSSRTLSSMSFASTPRGGTIHLHAYQAGRTIVIDIADTGPGVPPDERDKVFQAFYSGQTPQGGPLKGTGIGLSVVREFVGHGVGAALLSFPSSLEFAWRKANERLFSIPAAHLRAVRAVEKDSRPGARVLQRPAGRYPPLPVRVCAGFEPGAHRVQLNGDGGHAALIQRAAVVVHDFSEIQYQNPITILNS